MTVLDVHNMIISNSPITKYNQYHYRAVELRYEGNTYEQIALTISNESGKPFKAITVRRWFSVNGYLEQMYGEYAARENDRRRQAMRSELGKLVTKVPHKFQQLIDRKEVDALTLKSIMALLKTLGINMETQQQDFLDEYFDRVEDEVSQKPNAQADIDPHNSEVA